MHLFQIKKKICQHRTSTFYKSDVASVLAGFGTMIWTVADKNVRKNVVTFVGNLLISDRNVGGRQQRYAKRRQICPTGMKESQSNIPNVFGEHNINGLSDPKGPKRPPSVGKG